MRQSTDLLNLGAQRRVRVFNASGETIPGFACMAVEFDRAGYLASTNNTGGPESVFFDRAVPKLWAVTKPGDETEEMQNPYGVLFNGPIPIPRHNPPHSYGFGVGSMDFPLQALYRGELAQETPPAAISPPVADRTLLGQVAGPKSGQWELQIGHSAFSVLEFDFSAMPIERNDLFAFGFTGTASGSHRIWVAPRVAHVSRTYRWDFSLSAVLGVAQAKFYGAGHLNPDALYPNDEGSHRFRLEDDGTLTVLRAGLYRFWYSVSAHIAGSGKGLTLSLARNGNGIAATSYRETPVISLDNPSHGQAIDITHGFEVMSGNGLYEFEEEDSLSIIGGISPGSSHVTLTHGSLMIEPA